MSIDFQPRGGSAYDATTGVSIPLPRMLPSTLSDGRSVTEFQYAFLRDGERIGALGIYGSELLLEESNQREWLYTLELTHDTSFKSLRRFKQAVGDEGEEYPFLQAVAQGLVNVFAGRLTYREDQRNLVVTTADALAREGISVPDGAPMHPDGSILLADVRVAAHLG